MLFRPLLIVLDSSVINDIARDYFSGDEKRCEKANEIINLIYSKGYIPIITWHQIEEIIANKNDDLVNQSISLILQLPLVANLNKDNPFIGSIMDIEFLEVMNLINFDDGLENIISKVKEMAFNYTSGEEFLYNFIPLSNILREKALINQNRKREVASISRAKSVRKNDNLNDLVNGILNNPIESKKIFKQMKEELLKELENTGDKKLDSISDSVDSFFSDVFSDMTNFSGSVKEQFLTKNNISDEEFSSLKNMVDYDFLVIFKSRLKSIVDSRQILNKDKVFSLKESQCPTWLLWKELYIRRIKANRVTGSDLNDAFLVGLSLYVDIVTVDKRTHEYITQIKRKNSLLKPLINKVVKLKQYDNLIKYL